MNLAALRGRWRLSRRSEPESGNLRTFIHYLRLSRNDSAA